MTKKMSKDEGTQESLLGRYLKCKLIFTFQKILLHCVDKASVSSCWFHLPPNVILALKCRDLASAPTQVTLASRSLRIWQYVLWLTSLCGVTISLSPNSTLTHNFFTYLFPSISCSFSFNMIINATNTLLHLALFPLLWWWFLWEEFPFVFILANLALPSSLPWVNCPTEWTSLKSRDDVFDFVTQKIETFQTLKTWSFLSKV